MLIFLPTNLSNPKSIIVFIFLSISVSARSKKVDEEFVSSLVYSFLCNLASHLLITSLNSILIKWYELLIQANYFH